MKEMIKNAAILIAITVIAGFILGLVYETTKDTIAATEEADKKAAYREVFPEAADFTLKENTYGEDTPYMDATMRAAFDAEGYQAVTFNEINEAKGSDGTVLGSVYKVTTSEGYGGDITIAVGIKDDGTVGGISILTINETAGLGMNAEKVLKPQFAGKNVEKFVYTKTGAASDNEIDAISGATITTNAFTNAVNCCLKHFREYR